MWHIAVAILLGNQVLHAWQLPRAYANESLCMEQAQTFMVQWGPGNSLHEIGYRCIKEPLTT